MTHKESRKIQNVLWREGVFAKMEAMQAHNLYTIGTMLCTTYASMSVSETIEWIRNNLGIKINV